MMPAPEAERSGLAGLRWVEASSAFVALNSGSSNSAQAEKFQPESGLFSTAVMQERGLF
jgi:hypothetical protein